MDMGGYFELVPAGKSQSNKQRGEAAFKHGAGPAESF